MKTKFTLYIVLIFIMSGGVLAQSGTVTANIKVLGNCIMCKKRIETALDHSGIKAAEWDAKTKNLQVVYNTKKISAQKIHELIASIGHDTELIKADDEVYSKLPFCCLYRDHDHSNVKEEDEGHDHP